MKYIGLCGLHGAGKTHLALRLQSLGGWEIFNKRTVLKGLFESGWFRRGEDEAWEAWYRSIYQRFGSSAVMVKMLETTHAINATVIVDAIHTPDEWKAVKAHAPRSILVGVCSPQASRDLRRDELPEMDARRIGFWHEGEICLMSQVDWAFPGLLSSPLLDLVCGEFITYANQPPWALTPPASTCRRGVFRT